MTRSNQCLTPDQLGPYTEGAEMPARVRRHLEKCKKCRATLESLKGSASLVQALRLAVAMGDLTDEDRTRIGRISRDAVKRATEENPG